MAIVKQQTPYEFLVRWENGSIAGAHIRFLERLVEDGTVISEQEGNAQPVSMSGGVGFPIADILSAIQSSALADLATAQAAKATSDAALQTTQDALTAEQTKAATLQAQIDANAPPVKSAVATMRQAREALIRRGFFATVNNYIAAMPGIDGDIARNEWDKSQTVERSRPLTLAMAAMLGLNTAAMDEFYAFALTL